MRKRIRWILPVFVGVAAAVAAATSTAGSTARSDASTATPIKHVVVIFQENVSFDHYFGTYPKAANTDGQPFAAAPGTPSVNGLSSSLLTSNPNASNPVRLDTSANGRGGNGNGELTCDQDHNYNDEQRSFDGGLMDKFVQDVGTDGGTKTPAGTVLCNPDTVMDYYDGNAVTAMWNYAQHYAMSDNSYDTEFGPSAPGAIDVVSGDTGGVDTAHEANSPSQASSTSKNADITADGLGGFSLTSDAQPYWDDCSTRDAVALSGKNIGDELNAAGLSWGWFQGGFAPSTTFSAALTATGHAGQPTSTFTPDEFSSYFSIAANRPAHSSNQNLCSAVSPVGMAFGATLSSAPWGYKDDYIPHHEPFQYYASTANPHHLAPATLSAIGTDTQSYVAGVPQFNTANHNYDTSDFDKLVAAINAGSLPASALPAVTYLKAPGWGDGHAAYSDPADEQAFVVKEIDALQKTPDWSSTAVFINYDDSDGWYDHQVAPLVNGSHSVADDTFCTNGTAAPLANEQGRCGFSSRLPMIVISPWAKTNYVDHNLSDQASIINFIEYNWHLPGIPGSFDQALASKDAQEGIPFDLAGMFDFKHRSTVPTFPLSPTTGQIDLTGASLKGQNLKGQNLEGAQMSNADVQGTNLDGAFLANVDLAGASIQGTNLKGADLSGANLQGASLQGTNLESANLTNANLKGATLKGANLHNVIWSNTICPDGSNSGTGAGATCDVK
ncbi:MAG TPA: alkaline phosphatase family protein [Gaiellaceae bacterium]|nr:alkaline phosphatase family protein [Gaiellaceae bacterium]